MDNASIAERLGWELGENRQRVWKIPSDAKTLLPILVPDFLNDISAAWMLVEHWTANNEQTGKPRPTIVEITTTGQSPDWYVAVRFGVGDWHNADTAPLAICKAFMSATEEGNE